MATDPHPRWARRVRLLRQCSLEEPRLVAADQMAHQALDLIVRIVNTPSCTLGGAREQLALADQLLNEPDQRIGPADLAGRAVRGAARCGPSAGREAAVDHGVQGMTRSLLALRKVTPPAPEPVAGETLVYAADQHAGLAYVLSSYLSETDETDTHRTAALLADALQRQATLLRAFMGEPDDAEAEAPIGGPMDTSDAATEAPE